MQKKRGKGRRKSGRTRYRVFISHSSADTWIATQIKKEIKAVGAAAWLDTVELQGGDNLRAEIQQGITACAEAIVLATPNSIGSVWVSFEVGILSEQHKRITPILCYALPEELKTLLDVKAIELNDFDNFLSQLQRWMK